jgi:hypothetical protein
LPKENGILGVTEIIRANLVMVAKNTDSVVTLTHYIDGSTTGIDYTLSAVDTNRIANVVEQIYSTAGTFHNFKLVAVTDGETVGFEPLYFTVVFQQVRNKTR